MAKMSLTQKLNENAHNGDERGCCRILSRWWNVHYKWQQAVVQLFEHRIFHIAIIVFVIIDCLLVIAELILDFVKLRKECDSKPNNDTEVHDESDLHRMELAIEILHFSSLAVLSLFLIEVLTKVFVSGRHWWNIHKKKMEWLDAIIVIASFIVDLVIMFESNVFAEISLLFISLRLWRVIRIINGVAQTIQSEEGIKQKRLATNYHKLVEQLLVISEKKTIMMTELGGTLTPENYNEKLEMFEFLDNSQGVILQRHPQVSSLNQLGDLTTHL